MIQEKLNQLNLPGLLTFNNGSSVKNANDWAVRREEILHIMCGEVYGFAPAPPENVEAVAVECDEYSFAGKAVQSKILISFNTDNGVFSFPVNLLIPKGIKKPPVILHIAFRADIPDKYFPAEEVLDNGFAVASFCYNDITLDENDGFSSGLAKMYKRTCNAWGKIAMWAWSASRVMDYLQTLEEIDKENIAVMGHSRLGKAALLAGALDKRFAFVISNDSGCGGAAITRNKTGEHIKEITYNYGYWFCDNYKKYIDNENAMPFDQHFLLSAVAPRALYVASAKEDTWADPYSEYLCCVSVDCVYKLFDKEGFIHPNRYPAPGDVFAEGNVGYHLRDHRHFLSRYDWQRFMDFILKKRRDLMMSKTAVVYKSKYGNTKQYAEWIAQELGADLFETTSTNIKTLMEFDNIILGGGLYAGGISGAALISKNFELLKDKNLVVFTVGLASTDDKSIFKPIIEKNFQSNMIDKIKFFHLRGGMDYSKLSLIHKPMMAMLKSMVSKKKPEELTEEDKEMLETYGKKISFLDRETIKPIISYIKNKE